MFIKAGNTGLVAFFIISIYIFPDYYGLQDSETKRNELESGDFFVQNERPEI